MQYEGKAITVRSLDGGLAELRIDLKDDSVNKLSAAVHAELRAAVDVLKSAAGLRGVLVTSGKDVFVVGADVTEFLGMFAAPEAEMAAWLRGVHGTFNDLEDLPCPVVVAINGIALGGGLELALACSYRLMSATAKIGLPEVKLGIYPGWGGTVRLPRIAGADTAIEWIASGDQYGAEAALKAGVVDGVTAPEALRDAAQKTLRDAADGKLPWQARRDEKLRPLALNAIEAGMVFEGSKAFVAGKAGPHYPAPVAAIEAMQKGAGKGRDEAIALEMAGLPKVAGSGTARGLVSIFLGDQAVKKAAKRAAASARPVKSAAVLGAGIMGGGIAYQSASRGVPIVMKDIAQKQLDLGTGEAVKLLERQVEKGTLTPGKMAVTLSRIHPALTYADIGGVDLVVEAVVENEGVKAKVLAEVEGLLREDAILTSNTSTISITRLAASLKRPESFCGMHFFNPVHKMPLVEVIRGAKSSDAAIATTVAYAQALGKTPIVVGDCPGFLVNRILFPYFAGFNGLVFDGVDYARIDKVMEKWGWPQGPASLLDMVGIDTCRHAGTVMGMGFPDRMAEGRKTAIEAMYDAGRYGQKTDGKGLYAWVPQKKGPPKKQADPEAIALIQALKERDAEVTDAEIVERMMLPMLLEASRCLEDGIVATPAETDIALVYALGFPPFRGGIFRWADTVGAAALLALTEKYAAKGPLYAPTAQLRDLAAAGKTFHA